MEKRVRGKTINLLPQPGWSGLAEAIIELAIRDAKVSGSALQISPYDTMSMQKRKRSQTRHKRTALKFFDSKWFDALCGIAGADPKILREAMQREFLGEK